MIINIGSKNPSKIEAVREVLREYESLEIDQINSIEVSSCVPEQPFGWNDTIEGSKERARKSFINCDYSIGLESGLIQLPNSKSHFYDVGVCSIFDGYFYSLGFSGGFEVPKKLVDLIMKEGINLSQACYEYGLSPDENIGSREGIVGLLTNKRIDRKEQIKQSIYMALPKIENPDLYK